MTYQTGTAINLVQDFWTIDPLTQIKTPADPDFVVFTIEAPDGTQAVYTFGSDPNVTKPSVGVYICGLGPYEEAGMYSYRCVGSGTVEATDQGTFEVLSEGITPDYPPVATPGVCSGWISGEDVATCVADVEAWQLDSIAASASLLVYQLSARQFPGLCERTVRPCRNACMCFGIPSLVVGPWAWSTTPAGLFWTNECGDKCGCGSNSSVRLAGYPVRQVLEVKIDGDVVDPDTYFLDSRGYLIRRDIAGPPVVERRWPACQNLSLTDDQQGTFSITYRWGTPPPQLGKDAAIQLACELWSAQTTGQCKLPSRVTKVVRQGTTIERVTSIAEVLRTGSTGLSLLDAFIAFSNPNKLTRRPAVFSPDVQAYPRQER